MIDIETQERINTASSRALDKFGEDKVIGMVVGEIGKLLTLFGRVAQNRDTEEEWSDEIADVIIMLFQLTNVLSLRSSVSRSILCKLARLEDKLGYGR